LTETNTLAYLAAASVTKKKNVLTTLIPEEATGNSCMTLFFSAAVNYLKKEKTFITVVKALIFISLCTPSNEALVVTV
jgi:hypothetical protein